MTNNDLTEYSWWEGKNPPHENLKTKKQLAELGLKPVKAVGIIYTRKFDCLLYNINDVESVKPKRTPSKKQLQALKEARKQRYYKLWLRDNQSYYSKRFDAIRWARKVLENKKDYVILDTETTGLESWAEICQIGIVNLDGKILLNSLVKPSIPIPPEVTGIHGIDDNMVMDAPTFGGIYPQIEKTLKWKEIIIYNADFDRRILNYCCQNANRFKLSLKDRCHCAMEIYARYYGDYSDYYDDFKWQPLNGGHNAISDCLACLDLIKKMADSKIFDLKELFDSRYYDDDDGNDDGDDNDDE